MHNKCTVPTCDFPNLPQVADGTFNCLGKWKGKPCTGTYYVSPSAASTVMEKFRKELILQENARTHARLAEVEIKRQRIMNRKLKQLTAKDPAATVYGENGKIKEGSTIDDNQSSPSSLARKAARRRRPTDPKPTSHSTEQQQHASYHQLPHLELYPPVLNNYRAPVDQRHLDRPRTVPPKTLPPSHGSTSAPSASYEQNPLRRRHIEARVYDYHQGGLPSRLALP